MVSVQSTYVYIVVYISFNHYESALDQIPIATGIEIPPYVTGLFEK